MNPKSRYTALAMVVALSGCTALNDGVQGKFHRYDPNEYQQTVTMVTVARTMSMSCSDPVEVRRIIALLDRQIDYFLVYAQGRPNNSRTVTMATEIKNMIVDSQQSETMSEFFCRERAENITKATEILRASSGEKPE